MDFNYLSKDEAKLVILVCRLCMHVTDVCYPISYIKILLNDVLPDLDLSLSKDPVACMNCVKIISTSFNFKKMCMEKEKKIRDCYEKTNNPINLYTLIETQEDSVAMPNLIQSNLKDLCKVPSEIPAREPICKIEMPHICDSTSDIGNNTDLSTNNIIDKPEQKHKLLLENKHIRTNPERKLESTGRISEIKDSKKLSCLEENKKLAKIKDTFTEDSETPDNNMSEVIEIVESDINSDNEIVESDCNLNAELEWSDKEDMSFKEFGCKGANINLPSHDKGYGSGYGYDGMFKSNETIKEEDCIQIVDHHIELNNSDSDMIFTEEFSRDSFKSVTPDLVRVTKEETISLSPYKSLKSDNILSALSGKYSKTSKKKNQGELHKRVGRSLFICMVCDKSFTQKLHVNGHLLTKHRDIPDIEKKVDSKIHYCQYCSYRTINNYTLAKHIVCKHSNTSKKKNRGKLHKRVGRSLFICMVCDKLFTQKLQVNGHLLTKHRDIPDIEKKVDSKIHYCQYCSYRTISNYTLAKHIVCKHSNTSKKKNRGKLHKRVGRSLFICMVCDKLFTQKLHVNGHLLTKHRDIPDIEKKVDSKIHYCQYCSYRTISNYILAKHIVCKHKKTNGI